MGVPGFDEMMRAGRASEEEGRYHDAAACYGDATYLDPGNRAARRLLERAAHAALGEESGLDAYDARIRASPRDPAPLIEKGRVMSGLGMHEEAAECFARASGIDAGNAEAMFRMGCAMAELDSWDAAIRCLEAAASLGYESPAAAGLLEYCAWGRDNLGGDPDRLARHMEEGDRLASEGRAAEAAESYGRAVGACDAALVSFPEHHVTYLMRGVLLDKAGRHDEATRSFDWGLYARESAPAPEAGDAETAALSRAELGIDYEVRRPSAALRRRIAALPGPRRGEAILAALAGPDPEFYGAAGSGARARRGGAGKAAKAERPRGAARRIPGSRR